MLLIFALSVVSGCGSVKTGTVTGKVIFEGKPLQGGTVTFQTPVKIGESLTPYTFEIAEDGTFTATKLPYGEYQVGFAPKSTVGEVAAVEKNAQGARTAAGGPATPPAPQPPPKVTLPATIMDPMTSGVTFTVNAPMANNDFELK